MSGSSTDITIWGSHAVGEALASKQVRVHEIFVADSGKTEFEKRAREKRVPVRKISRHALSEKAQTDKHQNVVARVTLIVWNSIREWWREFDPKKDLTILAVDGVQDPQNLGSLIRSGHFFGADLFLLTKDRVAPITGVVAKASAGALFSLPVVRATNLARELEELGEMGVFRIALDQEGERPLCDHNVQKGHLAIIIGGEGQGIRTLTAKRCDVVSKLTSVGGRDSLNAAIAGGIALYELGRQRPKS